MTSAASSFSGTPLSVEVPAPCFGCGKLCKFTELRKCSRCKRAFYCSRECQVVDWKKPRNHKSHCLPNLLELAMDNIDRLDVNRKMALMTSGQFHLIPNANINQTICRVRCQSIQDFIRSLREEYNKVVDIPYAVEEALGIQGSCQYSFTDNGRYGLDIGVQSLCLALHLWPGVFTINSCSGLHAAVFGCEEIVQYVSDDAHALSQIQSIIEKGEIMGTKFQVLITCPQCDRLCEMEGFATISCNLGPGSEKPKMCRTWCREVRLSDEPLNTLDKALRKEKSPFRRIRASIYAYLCLALELVYSNPNLQLQEIDRMQLDELYDKLKMKKDSFDRWEMT